MTRRGRKIGAAAALALGVLGGACSAESSPAAPRPAGPAATGLVLIVNDTMRRDRPGVYGGPASTPRFDAFAREHLLFLQAYSQAPWTKPSMASLFTSLYPSQHGLLFHPQEIRLPGADGEGGRVRIVGNDVLGDDFTTLAELLQRAGWRTAAFVGNPWMDRQFGFAQGFEVYEDSFAGWDVPGEVISRAGLRWLDAIEPGQRFFLYLHYMDSHRPYGRLLPGDLPAGEPAGGEPAGRLPEEEAVNVARHLRLADGRSLAEAAVRPSLALLRRGYDRGVEAFDRALGVLLDGIAGRADWSRTAVVVTSDHGEALFTRGYGNHGKGLYEDEIAVPLAARLPGLAAAGLPLAAPVGLIDLVPTLCDYLGLDRPQQAAGRSWVARPDAAAGFADRALVSEGVTGKPGNRAVRRGPLKLLWQPQLGPDGTANRLFRVADDPGERVDLLAGEAGPSHGGLVEELLRAAAAAAPPIEAPAPEIRPLDERTLERLRALGYVD